jgi:hypothetical protein
MGQTYSYITNAETQPETQPITQPITQPTTQPEAQPTTQPTTQPATQPATQPTTQPATQPATQPETQPTIQPETRPTTRPETQPEMQPETRPETDIDVLNIITAIKCINYKSERKRYDTDYNINFKYYPSQLYTLVKAVQDSNNNTSYTVIINGESSKSQKLKNKEKINKEKNDILLDIQKCIDESKNTRLSNDDIKFIELFKNNKRIYNKYNLKSATLVSKQFVLYMHNLLKEQSDNVPRKTVDTINYLNTKDLKKQILIAFYYLDWLDTGSVKYKNSDYIMYAEYACAIYYRFLLNEYFNILKNSFNKNIKYDSHYVTCIINKCANIDSQNMLETLYLSQVLIPSGVIAEITDYENILSYHTNDFIELDNGFMRELSGREIFENYLSQEYTSVIVNEKIEDELYKKYDSNYKYRPSNTKYPVNINNY